MILCALRGYLSIRKGHLQCKSTANASFNDTFYCMYLNAYIVSYNSKMNGMVNHKVL